MIRNKDVILDFNDTAIPIIEPITKTTYLHLKVKYLFATPLYYDGDLYACVIYTSTISDITTSEAILNLKIASKLLESKLINLFYQENLQAQKIFYKRRCLIFKDYSIMKLENKGCC